MIVYIAGPITGDAGYRLKFAAAEKAIRRRDPSAVVINPALLPEGMDRADYMAICLPMLMRADVVYLLPGWRSSGGAQVEKRLAEYLRIRTVEISFTLPGLELSDEELLKSLENINKQI